MTVLVTLLEPVFYVGSRTWVGWWIPFVLIAVWVTGRNFWSAVVAPLLHRSSGLDFQLLVSGQLLRALGRMSLSAAEFGFAAWVVSVLQPLGTPAITAPPWLLAGVYTLTIFVAWDASRYVVHRTMHAVPWLWEFHQVHHSAEVLTPFTIYRVHPLESLLMSLRDIVVTGLVAGSFYWATQGEAVIWTLMGAHGITLVLNGLLGNLRHSQVHLGLGPLENLVLSPAQHQLHHHKDGERSNYGTWLAIWDQLGGSFRRSGEPITAFGVEERNHDDDLVSAWFGPFRAILGRHSSH